MEPGVDIAQQIAELRRLSAADLRAKYREVWGREPRVKHSREFLFKRIAWRLQEIRFGGLSQVARDRLEELIGQIQLPAAEDRRTVRGTLKRPAKPGDPAVGTTIVRVWRGKEIQVRVLEAGFEWNGEIFKSLSAVAQAVTGSHWNGKLFFGLVGRKRAK